MFGPPIGDTSPIVQSICDYKEIPHIQTRWDNNQKRGSCQINLYPHPNTLAQVNKNIHKYNTVEKNLIEIVS